MPFSTDRGLRRRLVFTLPVQLDREMRRLAFELDQSPGKTTVSSYVEHCIREQMKRDAQEVRKRASLDARFAGKAVPRTGYVELAERVARGLPAHCENGAQLYDGRCDPRRAEECERDAVNMIDPSEGGHVFGMEGPQSIGPTWCARCGARQEVAVSKTMRELAAVTQAAHGAKAHDLHQPQDNALGRRFGLTDAAEHGGPPRTARHVWVEHPNDPDSCALCTHAKSDAIHCEPEEVEDGTVPIVYDDDAVV